VTEEETKIARAFVGCGRWKWLPGMLDTNGGRMVDPGKLLTVRKRVGGILGETWQLHCNPADYISGESEALPDITDPATLGCIRHIVVDVLGIVDWDLTQAGSAGWYFGFVTLGGDDFDFWGNTEAEPLLRALQAAPEVKNE